MLPLTLEQQHALESDARITVVSAGPGSGKTRLFVEAVRKYLQEWGDRRTGLAALSFTNVAQNEIAARMGGRLTAPHFVGTLDSFMLRFVVRPFAHLVNASPAGVRLIPSPLDRQMRAPEVKTGSSPKDTISIFQVRFNQGVGLSLTFKYTDRMGRNTNLPPQFGAAALNKKQALWKNSGLMSHSDTHYLAALILESYPLVASLIIRRLNEYLALMEKEATANKKIKEALKALDVKVAAKYGKLGKDEIKILVVDDKWMGTLAAVVQSELNRVSRALTGRIKQLAERYAAPMPVIEGKVEELSAKMDAHLKKMGFAWQ